MHRHETAVRTHRAPATFCALKYSRRRLLRSSRPRGKVWNRSLGRLRPTRRNIWHWSSQVSSVLGDFVRVADAGGRAVIMHGRASSCWPSAPAPVYACCACCVPVPHVCQPVSHACLCLLCACAAASLVADVRLCFVLASVASALVPVSAATPSVLVFLSGCYSSVFVPLSAATRLVPEFL